MRLLVIRQPRENISSRHRLSIFIFPANLGSMKKYMQKSLLKNYQNILDEVPRNMKPFFHKYILWQQGKGQHSIQFQKYKINEHLSQLAKQLIQAKLQSLTNEIKQHQNQTATPKSLFHIFVLKNKLACIYSHLELNGFANDVLSDLWNQLLVSFRCLMKLPPSTKLNQKLDYPQDIPKLPYIFSSTNQILGYFQAANSTAYLRIITHAFFNLFYFNLAIKQYYEALSKLKMFLDYVLNNVLVLSRRTQWTKQQSKLFQIARNAWVLDVVFKCFDQYQKSNNENQNQNKKPTQANQIHVSICSMLRNSIQRIGFVLYDFDNYSIFPATIEKQLQMINDKIKKIKQPWKSYKQSIQSLNSQENQSGDISAKSASFYIRQQFKIQIPQTGPFQLKLRTLISKQFVPSQKISKILINFQTFTEVYLEIIQIMHLSLKNSPFTRIAKSLKLTLQRATIYLGDWQHHQQFQNEPYQFQNIWPKLCLIEKLYRMFFVFVKNLSDGQNLETLRSLLSQIVKDQNLRQYQDQALKIVKNIQETLSVIEIKCKLALIHSIQITNEKLVKFDVKDGNIAHFIEKAKGIYIRSKELMLHQGQKLFQLTNISCKQQKRCQKCQKQCTNMCLQKGEIYTVICGEIKVEEENYQSLFYIEQIVIKISLQAEKQVQLFIGMPKQKQKQIFKMNTPNLTRQDQQNNVYSEVWTPFVFNLTNFRQDVIVNKVCPGIVAHQIQMQQLAQPSLQNHSIQISNIFCVQKGRRQQNSINYYKVGQQINLKLQKSLNQTVRITIFVKSEKPKQILRNSKRKIEQHIINELIQLEVVLKSTKMNKNYSLKCNYNSLKVKPLISVYYHLVQTYQQFVVTNLRNLDINISNNVEQGSNENVVSWVLQKDETLSIEHRIINISVSQYTKMGLNINLNDWFDSQQLLQQKNNSFKIWYKQCHVFKIMKPIQIQSEETGTISIPCLNSQEIYGHKSKKGFEFIGKTMGEVTHIRREQKCINLWLVPTQVGNIMLPEIWINGKRGIWVNSILNNVTL